MLLASPSPVHVEGGAAMVAAENRAGRIALVSIVLIASLTATHSLRAQATQPATSPSTQRDGEAIAERVKASQHWVYSAKRVYVKTETRTENPGYVIAEKLAAPQRPMRTRTGTMP